VYETYTINNNQTNKKRKTFFNIKKISETFIDVISHTHACRQYNK